MTRSPAREMMAAGTLFADSFRYGLERYGSNRNRHWWGIAHRQWLVNSGQYIKTSEQRAVGIMQFISEIPEPYQPDYVGSWGKRLEQLRNSAYPNQTLFPHHHGAALWMPSEPGSRHWPGCGCP